MTLKDFIDEIFSEHDSSDVHIAGLQEAIDNEDVLGIFDGLLDVLQSIYVEVSLDKIFTLIFIKTGLINSSNVFDYVGAFGLGVTLFFYSKLNMKASNLVIDTLGKWEALQKTETTIEPRLYKAKVKYNKNLMPLNFNFNNLILYPRITSKSRNPNTFTLEEIFGPHGVAQNLSFFYHLFGNVSCNNVYVKKASGRNQIDKRNLDITGVMVSGVQLIKVTANTLNIDIVFDKLVIPTDSFKVIKFTDYSLKHKLNVDSDKPTAIFANDIFIEGEESDILSEIILPKIPTGTPLYIPKNFISLPDNIVISKPKGQELITTTSAKGWLSKHVREI